MPPPHPVRGLVSGLVNRPEGDPREARRQLRRRYIQPRLRHLFGVFQPPEPRLATQQRLQACGRWRASPLCGCTCGGWVGGWVLRCWAGAWRAGCALGACHAMRANIGAVGTDSLRSLWPPSLYHHISPTHTTITRDTTPNQPTNQLSRPNTQAAPQKCHPSDYLASSTSGPGLPLMRSALPMCTTP